MSYAFDNVAIMNDPRMIALCTGCDKPECTGICRNLSIMAREIAEAPGARPSKYRSKTPALYTVNGVAHTAAEWAEIIGVKEDTLRRHMKNGMSMAEAIAYKYEAEKLYTAHGRAQTMRQWAAESGIPAGTLRCRMYRDGMSFEQALDRGQKPRRR